MPLAASASRCVPPRPPLPLLITGPAGVAGYNAFCHYSALYPGQVFALRRPEYWPLDRPGILPCHCEDLDELRRLFDQYQFAAVLDCEGNCALKNCELDPELAWRVNVSALRHLLEVVIERQVRFVHLSIDLVYSGADDRGGYRETDPTDPVTVYGRTMAAAESLILAAAPAACILRISLPMGVSFNGHAGAIDWIQNRFKQNKPATLYYDEIRTPTYTDCLNDCLAAVLASDLRGIYHAGGPLPLSLYQIAQVVNRVGGYDPKLLMTMSRHEAGPIPPRAGNVAMDSSKLAEALGYQPFDPWPYDERFVPTHKDWHYERPADEPGSPELLSAVLYRNPLRRGEAMRER